MHIQLVNESGKEMPIDTEKLERCHECGLAFDTSSAGVNTHIDDYGDPDWESDADHVPFSLSENK